jgi:hypothetical protein
MSLSLSAQAFNGAKRGRKERGGGNGNCEWMNGLEGLDFRFPGSTCVGLGGIEFRV